jgi:hypothetical protein
MILQSTPVLFVDQIEPTETFFSKLGFERTVEVPDEDGIGFVILMHGGANEDGRGVMVQTRRSARGDMTGADPAIFDQGRTFLFLSVADVDAAARALEGHEIFLEKRETLLRRDRNRLPRAWRSPRRRRAVRGELTRRSLKAFLRRRAPLHFERRGGEHRVRARAACHWSSAGSN